jgi:hypothetical protein
VRFAALAFAFLALAACQQNPPAHGARDDSVPPLTADGYGDLRIGMSIADARRVSGQPLDAEALEPEIPGACSEQQYRAADGDQLWLMFEQDRITRITAGGEAPHTRTEQNVGVGSTDAEVRAAYPDVIEQPAKYDDPPAHDLVAWTTPQQSGLRFEVNAQGVVSAVHAGGPSILYVEGCA